MQALLILCPAGVSSKGFEGGRGTPAFYPLSLWRLLQSVCGWARFPGFLPFALGGFPPRVLSEAKGPWLFPRFSSWVFFKGFERGRGTPVSYPVILAFLPLVLLGSPPKDLREGEG